LIFIEKHNGIELNCIGTALVNALFVQFLLKNIVSEQNRINIESGKSFDI